MPIADLNDVDAALDMLEPGFARISPESLRWTTIDPDRVRSATTRAPGR